MFTKKAKQGVKPTPKSGKTFTPTQEQIKAKDNAIKYPLSKVEAVAGSGKSTSLFYIAGEIPEKSIYLAYNKTMATEAQHKCRDLGIDHVTCMTTHSLAYRNKGSLIQHKLSRPRGKYVNVGVNGKEISILLRVPALPVGNKVIRQPFTGLIIKETVDRFETSAELGLSAKHIPQHHIKDLQRRYGVNFDKKHFTKFVVKKAQQLWELRTDLYEDTLATHNTYLKLYQLDKPDLSDYSVIYLDESQDLNPVTYDIVMQNKNKCKIVLVGDSFQSIYAFNNAQNFISKEKCPSAELSTSFRFGQEVADIATIVLEGKMVVKGQESIKSVVGGYDSDVIDMTKPYTILYRTNMRLILDGLDLLTKGEDVAINIDVKDFIKLLTSCQALYDGNLKGVKHDSILPFDDWSEVVDEALVDPEISRVVRIVESGETERTVDLLTSYKYNADAKVVLTSAHKAKGLEFNQLIMSDDFPSNYDREGRWVGLNDQERNLLYVSVTRAGQRLQYNSTVQEFIDRQSQKENNSKTLEVGSVSVTEVDKYVLSQWESEGLPTPTGEMAQEALHQGIEEYFDGHYDENSDELVDSISEYQYNRMPLGTKELTQELHNVLKDLK